MKLKYKLPLYKELDHLSINSDLLSQCKNLVIELDHEFKSALEVNRELCKNHPELTLTAYENFYQIALTESKVENMSMNTEKFVDDTNMFYNDGKYSSARTKNKLINDQSSSWNEHVFDKKTELYIKHQSLFDNLLSKFRSPTTRIRLVKLLPGGVITPHIDYDPSYAVRVIIPIFTSELCINMFWQKNDIISTSFKEGVAYFLNTGFRHAVINFDSKPRYNFMITVNGTEDIRELLNNE